MEYRVPRAVATYVAKLKRENELLRMQIDAQREVIAIYRDTLGRMQTEQQVGTAIGLAELEQLKGRTV